MNKKLSFYSHFLLIFVVTVFTFLFSSTLLGQPKPDLEVKVQSASETVRGGEVFSYAVTVTNRGPVSATDVILLQTSRETISAANSSVGLCSLFKDSGQIPTPFRCMLGNIKPNGTAIINFKMKIRDFGGEGTPAQLDNRRAIADLSRIAETIGGLSYLQSNSIGDIDVRGDEAEENYENNHCGVVVRLLPSHNLPPQVKILSPISEAVIIRPAKKLLKSFLQLGLRTPTEQSKKSQLILSSLVFP